MRLKLMQTGIVALLSILVATAQTSGELTFTPDAAGSAVTFSLDATMHTVHGTFALKKGSIHLFPESDKISGEIVLDATSAKTGIDARDRKMHSEIIESDKYPEITFVPVHVEGKIATQGKSTVQIHGVFTMRGTQHEMTVPTDIDISPDHWLATSHFAIPYVQWGMKDPSNFLLHVKDTVQIEAKLSGTAPSK
jgi:polyisoprenoid-binding protein YceI